MRLRIRGWKSGYGAPFCSGQARLESIGDFRGNIRFDREDVDEFAVITLGPKVGVRYGIDQLHVHPCPVACPLHASLQDVCDPQLLRDFADVVR